VRKSVRDTQNVRQVRREWSVGDCGLTAHEIIVELQTLQLGGQQGS
jgi:hypothetical protein